MEKNTNFEDLKNIKSMLKVLPNEAGAINEEDLKEIFKQND